MKYALLLFCFLVAALAAEVDYYEILGLGDLRENATEKDIKQSFRKMSKQHHPDVSTASLEEAKKKFTDIQRANEVLSDKRRRKMYDMRGEEGLQMLEQHLTSGQQQQQHPFAHLFGGAESSFKGPDAEVRLEVNLVDFFTGGERLLNLKKRKVCPVCRGQGYPADVTMRQCSSCRGQGIIRQRIQFAPGMMQEVQQHCPHCQGRGKVPTHLCHRCHGHRLVDGVSNLHVPVEKGGTEGQAVVFEMEAEEQVDRLPGDLTVRLYSTPHPRFSRRRRHGGPAEDPENNLDLDTTLVISLKEALLGFRHTFLHMDEQEEVVVEKSGITAHGTVITLQGKGMPRLHVPSERGDLYVTIKVLMPSSLTNEQKEWIEKNLR